MAITKLKMNPSISFLKFPWVVQAEIIKTLMPFEQYLLSKCSKRAFRVVKKFIPKKHDPEIWVYPVSSSVHFYLRIVDTKFVILRKLMFYPEYQRAHAYLCDLFGTSSDVYLDATGYGSHELLEEKFLRDGSVKKSILLKKTRLDFKLNKQLFDQFLKRHPNQELILMEGSYAMAMQPGHNFLEARNLMISSMEGYCPCGMMSSFKGEHLLLEDVCITTFFLEVFVDNWIKKGNNTLKSVILKLQPGTVLTESKFEKLSGSSKYYQYMSQIEEYHRFPKGIFDCSGGWDIRRESDGKVATFKKTRDYFMFLVW